MSGKSKTFFLKCACGSEGLGLDYDAEDELYYFSYWSCGLSNKRLDFKQRIRYCWNVLTKGKAFNDELLMRQEDVNKLTKFLSEVKLDNSEEVELDFDYETLFKYMTIAHERGQSFSDFIEEGLTEMLNKAEFEKECG